MKTQKGNTPARSGRRHPLILQKHLNEQVFWPSVLTLAIAAGLILVNRGEVARYRAFLALTLVAIGQALVLTFVYRLRAYVQCRSDGLYVRLPFYRLTVPYAHIRATRPNDFFRLFPPDEQSWAQRSFLHGLWSMTVVLIDLEALPRSRAWLRLWMSKYMLDPNGPSLSLAVGDWIAFQSELDECLSRQRRLIHRP